MKKSVFLTSLVVASVLFTACGGGSGNKAPDDNQTVPDNNTNKPVFTSPNSYDMVEGERKAIILRIGEAIPDAGGVIEFKMTDFSQAPLTKINKNTGVVNFRAPNGNSPVTITVTATRIDGGAVSEPMTITFTPVNRDDVITQKVVRTGSNTDFNSTSSILRTFKKDDTTFLDVQDATSLIWADTVDSLAEGPVSYVAADEHCKALAQNESGWRMPNKDELLNLIDYSKPSYKAVGDEVIHESMIPENKDGDGFENRLNNVWAKQELGRYIYISENDGTMNYTTDNNNLYVRCVKGPEADRNHLIYSDLYEYTYDLTTRLEWSPATDNEMSTVDAIEYCRTLSSPHKVGGVADPHTGFRLPSINEVRSITENWTISNYITQGNRAIISSTPFVDENGSITTPIYSVVDENDENDVSELIGNGIGTRIMLREAGIMVIGGTGTDLTHRVICVRDMD